MKSKLPMARHGSGVYRVIVLLTYAACFYLIYRFVYHGYFKTVFHHGGGDVVVRSETEDMSLYTPARPPAHSPEVKGDLLDRIQLDCDGLRDENNKTMRDLKLWHYDYDNIERDIMEAEDKCAAIKDMFYFPSQPLSKDEADYPLAYGAIVYKEIAQVLFMLSSFYHPQNEYCFAVSGSAKPSFKKMMQLIGKCFHNVKIMDRPKIFWGAYEIINSTYTCMETMTHTKTPWKYFQYLSGVDIPLRTNREMVLMLKAMNNTINAEVKAYQRYRARQKDLSSSPMMPYKSSLSATIPRTAVDYMIASKKTAGVLDFLYQTSIPDEGFWGTIAGNPDVFPIPGGYNASAWLKYRALYYKENSEAVKKHGSIKIRRRYYMSRYQVWNVGCKGLMKAASCVFGLGDYATLIRQPHLVAHKLYIDFEPATYFCALKEIRRRTREPEYFNTTIYTELPQVELQNGIPFEKLTHPEWLF